MPIIAQDSGGKDFKPAPEGLHAAVCVDVVDLGVMENKFNPDKPQHKCRIIWQLEERDPENNDKRFVVARMYTISLNEKATLRKDLESWRGRAFTEEELNGWDVESVITVPALINVVHNAANGSVYANVATIMRVPKGMPIPAIDPTYVRVQDRPKDENAGAPPNDADWQVTDDDVPF